MARDTVLSTSRELMLDWQRSGTADVESRLQRLAAWVLAAERQGLPFGLQLPGLELAPAAGDAQRREALTSLALWRAPQA